jgi:transcriptional regulator with XRE-family HTH domain
MARLLDIIRQAIRQSDKSPAQIAKEAGVAKSQLSRLLSEERGLSVDVLERVAEALNLRITIEPKGKSKER